MRISLSLGALLLGLFMAAPAQAIEVETGVRPEERERVRVNVVLSRPDRHAALISLPGPALRRGQDGSLVLPFSEELCDLPCTVRVPSRGQRLMVQGDRWQQPIRLERYQGRDIDLIVRPGRPGATLTGLLLTSLSLTFATMGSAFWITGSSIGRIDGEEGPSTMHQLGRGFTLGGLGGMTLGLGLVVRGSSGVRQRNRRR